MSGCAGAHDLVVGGHCVAAGVTGDGIRNALQIAEDRLHAPEAAAGEDDLLGLSRAAVAPSKTECEREGQGRESFHISYNASRGQMDHLGFVRYSSSQASQKRVKSAVCTGLAGPWVEAGKSSSFTGM